MNGAGVLRRAASLVLMVAVASASLVRAQSDSGARPKFDVASVKPNTSGEPGLRMDIQPGGRFIAYNIPLKQLIRAAYMVQRIAPRIVE